jgi:glycosyltransferase involved in cell wall biosynthesis
MTVDQHLKKIAINGRFLTQPITGVQRYAYELVRAWDIMLANGEIDSKRYKLELFSPHLDLQKNEFRCIPVQQVGRLKGNLWEQIELPWYTRGEFLFNPCNIGPLIKLNQAVTIHDASVFAVPESYSLAFRMKYGIAIFVLAKTARLIFTVSQFSKNELVRYGHISAEKLVVVYEGCDHIYRISSDQGVFEKYHIGDKPYILAVGSNASHKNFSVLDEVSTTLSAHELEIIIVGGEFRGGLNPTYNNKRKIIKRLGYVAETGLKALYERATVFVLPSYYEGFGLPPLEAMACSCPVIVSRIPSLKEICGEAVVYVNPGRQNEIAENILFIQANPSLRERLITSGINQSQKYRWSVTAKEIWKILQESGAI